MGDVVRIWPGNGAREALIEVALDLPNTSDEDARVWTDWLLAELWSRGFWVVPIPDNREVNPY